MKWLMVDQDIAGPLEFYHQNGAIAARRSRLTTGRCSAIRAAIKRAPARALLRDAEEI
jgi:hypothetical protein